MVDSRGKLSRQGTIYYPLFIHPLTFLCMKRSIVLVLVLVAAVVVATTLFGIKGGVLAIAGSSTALIMVICIAGVIGGMLALIGAPSALADKILKAVGLIK